MADFWHNHKGAVQTRWLLVIISAIGLISFLLIASSSPFGTGIFNQLFPKPPAKAEDALQDITNQLLQKSNAFKYSKPTNPNNRIAAAWSNTPNITADLSFPYGEVHKVRFYSLDWDNSGRAQNVDVLEASSGAVLDHRSLAALSGGKYLTWNLSGHVLIRYTRTAGASAVLSGIFFDPAPPGATFTPLPACPLGPLGDIDCSGKIDIFDYNTIVTNFGKTVPPNTQGDLDGSGKIDIFDYNTLLTNFGKTQSTATAQFVAEDSTTQGSWEGVYGTEGYFLAADAQVLPSYAQLTITSPPPLTWSASTTDVRALQKPTDRAQLIIDMTQIAQTRQNLLETDALTDPKHAALYTLSPAIVHGFAQPIQPYLEQEMALAGKLNITTESLNDSVDLATTYNLGGYKLAFAQFAPPVTNASLVNVKGSVIGQTLLMSQQAGNQLQVTQAAPIRTTTGKHTVAVILFNFADNPSRNDKNGFPITTQSLKLTFFGSNPPGSPPDPNKPSVDSYYQDNSFKLLSFDPDPLKSKFFDWSPIPSQIISTTCDPDNWVTQANPPGEDLTKFDHVIYVFPKVSQCNNNALKPNIPQVAGWADLGGNRVFINGSPSAGTIGHEIGHNLGINHANILDCGKVAIDNSLTQNTCFELAPPDGDPFDLMGSEAANSYPHFNGPHKIAAGWIPQQNIQTVSQSGTYHLAPLELASVGTPLVLKINKYTPPGFQQSIPALTQYKPVDYYLDYRGKIGLDTNIDPQGTQKFHDGSQIHLWDNLAFDPTLLIKFPEINSVAVPMSLPQGNQFIDSVAGVTITQQQVTANDATVDIQLDARNCIENAPLITVDPVPPATFAGQAITYPIHLTNTDSDQCTKKDFSLSATAQSGGWSFAFSKALVTLLPGETADLNLTITSPTDLADGVTTLTVTAEDSINLQHSNSENISYTLISGIAIACNLTNPLWSFSQTTKDTVVSLTVTATDPCTGQMVNFEVRRSGIPDIAANIQPPQIKITGQTVNATWTAEHNPLIPGTSPNYYFLANIVGQTKTVKSSDLLVTDSAPLPTTTIGGTGADGSVTFTVNTNLSTTNIAAGRTCSDGGDAVSYSVSSLTGNAVSLTTTPTGGCLKQGDEVLLINLQGTATNKANVGHYETFQVQSISGNNINFSGNKTKFYGDANDDSNIGSSLSNQRVMLQRVPNYTDVTVNPLISVTASVWNGQKGGVLFFRANGMATIKGTLNASGLGYRGGAGGIGNCGNCGHGIGGESTTGIGTNNTNSPNPEGGGGAGRSWNGSNVNAQGAGGAGGSYGQLAFNGSNGNSSPGGIATGSYGEETLKQQIEFGSGGGGGGGGTFGGSPGGGGGAGGGILMLGINNLNVTGSIVSSGNTGGAAGGYGGSGGGGGGGAILINTTGTTTLGTFLVNALAGNGGCCGGLGVPGGKGSVGRIALYAASSASGATNPQAFTTSLPGGFDGPVTISANTNLNTTSVRAGRTCNDGGDGVNYSVTGLSGNSATLSSAPAGSCLLVGDEILLINLQGTPNNFANVGNYETFHIESISGNTVTFQTNKSKFYGNGSDDSNIGLTATNQRVMLQRVPNYTDLTVNSGVTVTASGWNGVKGGVLFLRASGNAIVAGSINTAGLGYRGGPGAAAESNTIGAGESTDGLGVSVPNAVNPEGGGAGGRARASCTGGLGNLVLGSGGGGGGYGTTGANGNDTAVLGGTGGPSYGDPALNNKLNYGSAGGGGGGGCLSNGGGGGVGGGMIFISAGSLNVTGTINASGTGGSGGNVNGGTGGGGAGGSVKLSVSGTATIGNNLVTAVGGGGGGVGGAGRIAISGSSTNGTSNPPAP